MRVFIFAFPGYGELLVWGLAGLCTFALLAVIVLFALYSYFGCDFYHFCGLPRTIGGLNRIGWDRYSMKICYGHVTSWARRYSK